jgi:hypothetical protein
MNASPRFALGQIDLWSAAMLERRIQRYHEFFQDSCACRRYRKCTACSSRAAKADCCLYDHDRAFENMTPDPPNGFTFSHSNIKYSPDWNVRTGTAFVTSGRFGLNGTPVGVSRISFTIAAPLRLKVYVARTLGPRFRAVGSQLIPRLPDKAGRSCGTLSGQLGASINCRKLASTNNGDDVAKIFFICCRHIAICALSRANAICFWFSPCRTSATTTRLRPAEPRLPFGAIWLVSLAMAGPQTRTSRRGCGPRLHQDKVRAKALTLTLPGIFDDRSWKRV